MKQPYTPKKTIAAALSVWAGLGHLYGAAGARNSRPHALQGMRLVAMQSVFVIGILEYGITLLYVPLAMTIGYAMYDAWAFIEYDWLVCREVI